MRRLALSDANTLLLYHIQKWIPSRTVKGPTIKLSEDNIWEYQCNLKVGKNFFFFSSTTLLLPTHLPPPSCTHAQSCNPMDFSPPGSSVHGLFQARILEWVAISFSREEFFNQEISCTKQKGKKKLIKWTALLFLYIKIYQKAKCNKHTRLYTHCFCVSTLLIWS